MSLRVAKLEGLLARVQARAGEPRVIRAAAAPAEASNELELDAPELDAPELDAPELDAPELDVTELDEPAPISDLDDIEDVEVDEIDDIEVDELDGPESGEVAASTMDDAIEAAKHQPPLTPPPESGEGVTSPQIPPREGPTMEQLGETIALEEGGQRDFELDEPILDEPDLGPASGRLMEAELAPAAPSVQEALSVPDNAREELDRVRLGDSTPIEARVSKRPVLSTNVVELVSSSRAFEPKSFLALVDSSLALK